MLRRFAATGLVAGALAMGAMLLPVTGFAAGRGGGHGEGGAHFSGGRAYGGGARGYAGGGRSYARPERFYGGGRYRPSYGYRGYYMRGGVYLGLGYGPYAYGYYPDYYYGPGYSYPPSYAYPAAPPPCSQPAYDVNGNPVQNPGCYSGAQQYPAQPPQYGQQVPQYSTQPPQYGQQAPQSYPDPSYQPQQYQQYQSPYGR